MNSVLSFFYHLWIDRSDRWYPLLGVYYLTYACDFRCPYCSDGKQKPYYALRSAVLPAAEVRAVLQAMRRHCEYIVITGGEPLKHPEFAEIIDGLKSLGFKGIILTTNGYELEPCLEEIAQSVDDLVFSVDTLDHVKADQWYGTGAGTLRQILRNIDLAAQRARCRFGITISSVVTPENIEDLFAVYHYARERRFRFAACPQLNGVKAPPALHGNRQYREFYDFLIAEKRQGRRIQGTIEYLEHLRDLRQFSCRPFTMLVVSPAGEVFYPCLEIGHFAGTLLEEPNLHRLRQKGWEQYGGQPRCGSQCHSACALGFASLLGRPLSLVREACLSAKGWINGC